MDEEVSRTPSPKRRRIQDENSQPNTTNGEDALGTEPNSQDGHANAESGCKEPQASALTLNGEQHEGLQAGLTVASASCEKPRIDPELAKRIEANRAKALELKRKRESEAAKLAATSGSVSVVASTTGPAGIAGTDKEAEMRARIERNRMLALQRKQQRQAAEEGKPSSPHQQIVAQAPTPQHAGQSEAQLGAKKSAADQSAAAMPDQTEAPTYLSCRQKIADILDELAETGPAEASMSSSSSEDSDSSSDDDSSSDSGESSTSSSSSSSDGKEEGTTNDPEAGPSTSLSDEQRERIEANRQAALERKRMADEKRKEALELIERNRQAAMERKRKLQETQGTVRPVPAVKSSAPVPTNLEYTPTEERDGKQKLVAQLLCRWWYVLPEWPPKGYDYGQELSRRLLRVVPITRWEREPELNAAGLRKVYALSQFPGHYRNSTGFVYDLRPVEGRPSYDRFITKSVPELYRLLLVAYRNQLAEAKAQLNSSTSDGKVHIEELKKRVGEVRSKAMFAMTFMKK